MLIWMATEELTLELMLMEYANENMKVLSLYYHRHVRAGGIDSRESVAEIVVVEASREQEYQE